MGMMMIQSIQNRIYEVRGERVMLDKELANLYEVETKVLNLAVKRNLERFPADFMFQLSKEEWETLRFQIETSKINVQPGIRELIVENRGGTRYLPYVFTEQGVAMLSSVLHSEHAIQMNISIMRAFVEIRKLLIRDIDLNFKMTELKDKIENHDLQLSQIYEALENLIDEKIHQKKWDDRERIGFRSER